MEDFDNNQLLYLQSVSNHVHDPIGWLSPFDPLSTLPDPLQTDITLLASPPLANAISPTTTEEDDANVEDLLKALPPDIPDTLAAIGGTPLDPAPEPPPTPSTVPTMPSTYPPFASSAFFTPIAASTAPSVSRSPMKRRFSIMDFHAQSQEPASGPSVPRPAKRPCIPYPGELSFQLDPTVVPLKTSQSTGQPMGKPREPRRDYSACKCEGGLTSKPARHWRACPYNSDCIKRDDKPFGCEFCDKRFGREDNKKRHIKEYHPEMI